MKLFILFIIFGFVVSNDIDQNKNLNNILQELQISPNTKLENLFPDLDETVQYQFLLENQINECYDKSVSNKTFDIFNDNVYSIIHHYFVNVFP